MKKSRLLAGLLAALMALSMLTACGGNQNDPATPPDPTPSGGDANTPGDTQTPDDSQSGDDLGKVVRFTMGDTPDTFNCQTTSSSYELVSNWSGKLYRYIWDEAAGARVLVEELADGDPVPENEDLRNNAVWTYKVAQGYTFEDGTPIDAHTFEYSIKMLNDPKLANRNTDASGYVNGVKYLSGECEWEEVGWKVIDDYTFQVTFAPGYEPKSLLDAKLAYETIGTGLVHPEMFESCLSDDGSQTTYGTTAETIVSSGPYRISKLIPGQYFEISKRTDGGAPLMDVYTTERMEWSVVSDKNTRIQLFEQGKLDMVDGNGEAFDEYEGGRYLYQDFTQGIFINSISPTAEVLKDVNFRYALFWGYDREGIAAAVARTSLPTACHNLPHAVIPDPNNEGESIRYMDTSEYKAIRMDGHEIQDGICYDPDLALEYFNKAYEANGNQKITITVLYYDGNGSANAKDIPEAIKDHYEQLFGTDRLELALQASPWAVMSEQIQRSMMEYDIALSSSVWNNSKEPWNSSNFVYGDNPYAEGTAEYPTQYCIITDEARQKEWSDLYYRCASGDLKFDPQGTLEATARMEEILYEDCTFIPTHISGTRYFFSSRIQPLMETGDPDLEFALLQCKFN